MTPLVGPLRRLKAREQAERASLMARGALREASYEIPGGRAVYYQGDDTLRDAADLYTVLGEDHGTGSPNVENMQARALVGHLQQGGLLSEVQIGLLRRLLSKHADRISALRASRDRDGQDMLNVPSAGPDSRIINPDEGA